MLDDEVFKQTLGNTFIYLIIQVPIMLVLAMVLANLLNNPNLKAKAFWRTAIFLPCAVGLVSYSLVFRTMFATDGFVNDLLTGVGLRRLTGQLARPARHRALRAHPRPALALDRLQHAVLPRRTPERRPLDASRPPASTARTTGRPSGTSRCRSCAR